MALDIEITLKNYRCFADHSPARINLRDGFTAYVGKNNSGKSTLLKFLYECRQLFAGLHDSGNLLESIRHNNRAFALPPTIPDVTSLASDFNERPIEITLAYRNNDWDDRGIPRRYVLTIPRGSNSWTADLYAADGQKVNAAGGVNNDNNRYLNFDNGWRMNLEDWRTVCDRLYKCFYIGAFRNAINIGANEQYFDIHVGQAFIRQWKAQQTGTVKKHRDASYALTRSIRDIFEFDDLQIHAGDDDKSLRVFVNGKSLDLVEMGAGLAQFIIVLANLSIRETSYILIDEPELNLHASLQMDFLTTLGTYASNGVLFATHSYGLARSSADWVYAVSKERGGNGVVRPLEGNKHLNELVGALSFSEAPELGFNKILLIESPHDGRALQQWLRFYRKEHSILLLPLGGSTLINGTEGTEAQLLEIRRITPNVSAVVDSERTSDAADLIKERKDFKELCERMGIRCHLSDRRALENYFTQVAIDKGVGNGHAALGPFESLKAATPGWPKSRNWLIAREMTKAEVDATDIGQFLSNL